MQGFSLVFVGFGQWTLTSGQTLTAYRDMVEDFVKNAIAYSSGQQVPIVWVSAPGMPLRDDFFIQEVLDMRTEQRIVAINELLDRALARAAATAPRDLLGHLDIYPDSMALFDASPDMAHLSQPFVQAFHGQLAALVLDGLRAAP